MTGRGRVPLVDLRAQTRALRAEVEAAWGSCLERCDFVLGHESARFEAEFADFLGARHAIGVGSGLDALTLALDGLGVGPGDFCVVPANTFVATPLAVSRLGARVAWCDVDPRTRLLSAATLERALAGLPAAVRPAARSSASHPPLSRARWMRVTSSSVAASTPSPTCPARK